MRFYKRNNKEIGSAEIKSVFEITEKIDTEKNIKYRLNESSASVKLKTKNTKEKLVEKYSDEYYQYAEEKDDKVVEVYISETNKTYNEPSQWDKEIFKNLNMYPNLAKRAVKNLIGEFEDANPGEIDEEDGETLTYYHDGNVYAFEYTYHVDFKEDEEHNDGMNGYLDAKAIAILDATDGEWAANVYREIKAEVTIEERMLAADAGDAFESDTLYELGKDELLKGDKVKFESKMIDTLKVTEKDPKIKLPKTDKYTKIEQELDK